MKITKRTTRGMNNQLMDIERLEYQHFDSTNVLWEIFHKLKSGWAVNKVESKISEYNKDMNWFKVYFERHHKNKV